MRQSKRHRIKDDESYEVFIHTETGNAKGFLDNISDTGLCVRMDSDQNIPAQSSGVSGEIVSRTLDTPVPFAGKTVWFSVRKSQNKAQIYAGINFDEVLNLPESLIAYSITREGE